MDRGPMLTVNELITVCAAIEVYVDDLVNLITAESERLNSAQKDEIGEQLRLLSEAREKILTEVRRHEGKA